MKFTTTFEYNAEKKHSVRYDETGDRRTQKIGAIYIRKTALVLERSWPSSIEVTVTTLAESNTEASVPGIPQDPADG